MMRHAALFLLLASCGDAAGETVPRGGGAGHAPTPSECPVGYGDCDGLLVTGCERRVDDVRHCGACDVVCPEVAGAEPVCRDGVCGFACLSGRLDCNGDAADGCEIDVTTDAENCSACGRSCLGAACDRGLCEPIVLADDGASPFGFGHQPHPLIIDATHVYFQTYGLDIKRVAKTGGPSTVLVPAAAQRQAWDLAVDDDHLYVHDSYLEQIVRVPKDGSGPEEVVSAIPAYLVNVGHLALSDDHVYWTQILPPPQRILRAPKSGGTAEVWHASFGLPAAIAVHGAYVYWVEPPGIYRAPTTDAVANPELYASMPPETRAGMYFALDDRGLFVNADPTEPPDYWLGGVVALQPREGLLVQDSRVLSLAIDATHVYYVSATQFTRVMRVPRDGSSPKPEAVLVKLDDFQFNPAPPMLEFLAVDDANVFYHEARKGLVLKVAK